jgi:hypothetical protein
MWARCGRDVGEVRRRVARVAVQVGLQMPTTLSRRKLSFGKKAAASSSTCDCGDAGRAPPGGGSGCVRDRASRGSGGGGDAGGGDAGGGSSLGAAAAGVLPSSAATRALRVALCSAPRSCGCCRTPSERLAGFKVHARLFGGAEASFQAAEAVLRLVQERSGPGKPPGECRRKGGRRFQPAGALLRGENGRTHRVRRHRLHLCSHLFDQLGLAYVVRQVQHHPL